MSTILRALAAMAILTLGSASAFAWPALELKPDRGTVIGMTLVLEDTATSEHFLLQYDADQLQQMGKISLRDQDYGTTIEVEKVFFDVMYPDRYVKRPVHSRAWVEDVDMLIWSTNEMTPDMIASLGSSSDWTQNDGMIVVEDMTVQPVVYHSVCKRAGHGGDDQQGGGNW